MPQEVYQYQYSMKLVPGQEYLYCACGLTNDSPFCDGSH